MRDTDKESVAIAIAKNNTKIVGTKTRNKKPGRRERKEEVFRVQIYARKATFFSKKKCLRNLFCEKKYHIFSVFNKNFNQKRLKLF